MIVILSTDIFSKEIDFKKYYALQSRPFSGPLYLMLFTAINEFFFHIYPDVNVILIGTALKDAYGNSVKAVIMGTFSLWIGSMIG